MNTNSAQGLLREIMRITGKPIKQVSELSGIPFHTLYFIYTGRTTHPTDQTMRRLITLYCQLIQKND